MKITFNELGVVTSTITDDESYRQGNVGNTLTAVFEGKNANNYIATFSYTRSDGSTIARLPMSIESSNSYKYTFNDVWFTELDGITTLTIYLYDSRNNIIANGQLQFNIEKTDFSEITSVTPDELNAWIAQLASKLDINSTQYIRFYPTINDSNYSELPVGTTFGVKETINTGLEEKIQFYQVNSRQGLDSLSTIRVQDFTITSGGFALANTLYTGRFLATPNAINIPYGLYLGWKDSNNNYYFIVNGKFYTTDVNLTSGSVSIVEDAVTKITRLTNLLVDENMQVRGQIYKGMGTPTENEIVLTRGEIKEEFVEQVKTGNKPRAYGINSLNEQTMYEIRVDRFPSTVMLRDANGNSYVADPTDDAHVANKGYVDSEITTLRDESMNYTDDMVAGAIAGLKDESGKIRSDLLPSYVDDVVEYGSYDDFPLEGKTGKIYIDLSTNSTYRWSGSQYFPLNVKGVEELERVTPTDIVAVGNTIKLYHDSNEITGQENPVAFKTINGEPIIGNGDIEVNGGSISTYNYDISPATAVVGTLTSEIVTALSDTNATITRAGELYRYSDKSDNEYLTYVHASIDTSKSAKPAVMRAIRINLTTYAWELLDYELTTYFDIENIEEKLSSFPNFTLSKEVNEIYNAKEITTDELYNDTSTEPVIVKGVRLKNFIFTGNTDDYINDVPRIVSFNTEVDTNYNIIKIPVKAGDVIRQKLAPYWYHSRTVTQLMWCGCCFSHITTGGSYNLYGKQYYIVYSGDTANVQDYITNGIVAEFDGYMILSIFNRYTLTSGSVVTNGLTAEVITVNQDASYTTYDNSVMAEDYVPTTSGYHTSDEVHIENYDIAISEINETLGDIETILKEVVGGVE